MQRRCTHHFEEKQSGGVNIIVDWLLPQKSLYRDINGIEWGFATRVMLNEPLHTGQFTNSCKQRYLRMEMRKTDFETLAFAPKYVNWRS